MFGNDYEYKCTRSPLIRLQSVKTDAHVTGFDGFEFYSIANFRSVSQKFCIKKALLFECLMLSLNTIYQPFIILIISSTHCSISMLEQSIVLSLYFLYSGTRSL